MNMTREEIRVDLVKMGNRRFIEVRTDFIARYYDAEEYSFHSAIAEFVKDWMS